MNSYHFVTVWHVNAPIETVWQCIYQVDSWPKWWPSIQKVERLSVGEGKHELGSSFRITLKSALPYRLTFDLSITEIKEHAFIGGKVAGELEGEARYRFSGDGATTTITYDWIVRATPWWMNLLPGLTRPIFMWNHRVLMLDGERSINQALGYKTTIVTETAK